MIDKKDLFTNLRKKYPKFIYKKYEINSPKIKFFYSVGEFYFTHYLEIENFDLSNQKYENIIFHIGLIEAISYYKIFCSEEFIIECGVINEKQKEFFNKLFYKGLSEFIFVNQIHTTQKELVKFNCTSKKEFKKEKFETKNTHLIPIGGGKDSIVTYELLKENATLFAMNPIIATKNLMDISQNSSITIKRVLDKQIIELNSTGEYLNGHIPFSAILSFITTFIAILNRDKYIILSNESSANEGNTIFNGLEINHQYSKSLEYENDFRAYSKKFITEDIEYFSFLRPLHEIQIAKLFSSFKNDDYFHIFRSCNVGSKKGIWCCGCSKCLFVYIMFSPFVSQEKLTEIFGENLFEKEELKEIFTELVDVKKIKPLECVGSYDEVNYAISLTIKKLEKLPYLLREYKKMDINYMGKDLLKDWNEENNLPMKYEEKLKSLL
jgi:hypothetical protein